MTENILISIIDGQGGGIGKQLVEKLAPRLSKEKNVTIRTATIMLHLGMGIKTFSASLFPIASAMRGVTSPKMEWGITIGITPAIIWDFPAFSTMAFSPVAPSSAPAFSMAFVARALVPRARIVTFFSR